MSGNHDSDQENMEKLRYTEGGMEQGILGISLRDRIRNEDIWREPPVMTNVGKRAAKLKWN